MQTKVCSQCGEEKPVSEFHKRKDGKYGVQSKCKDCNKANSRKQYVDNKESRLEYMSDYYQRNREYLLKQMSDYQKTEQGKLVIKNAGSIRRAQKYGNTQEQSPLTTKEQERMKDIETICPYCGCSLNDSNRQLDHIVPLSKGGPNSFDNVVYCCAKCNNRKLAKSISDWMERVTFVHYMPINLNSN